MAEDILAKLDAAWSEEIKINLMHYCDLAGQEIRKLRAQIAGKPEVAQRLRVLADNLWDVEFRLNVDDDAALLKEAANILDPQTALTGSTEKQSKAWR